MFAKNAYSFFFFAFIWTIGAQGQEDFARGGAEGKKMQDSIKGTGHRKKSYRRFFRLFNILQLKQ